MPESSPFKADIITTNADQGILDNIKSTFKNEALKGFYDHFYTIFLTKANSLPLNCQWVVWMDNIPWKSFETENPYTDIINGSIARSTEVAHNIITVSKKGMILAQSVQAVGETLGVDRTGTTNTGLLQGYVGTGRKGLPLLQVSFLENNVSFVDYVIRPWIVAVSYRSLKTYALKTNLTCWWMTRTGPRRNLGIRKKITYHNCCPVSLKDEEFNYTGDDLCKRRSVEFAYTHYTIDNADDDVINMMEAGADGFFKGLGKQLLQDLQRHFGANNPTQFVNNLIDKAQQFGKDMITSTVSRAVSNVAGNVAGVVNDAIQGATGTVMSLQNRGLDNLNDMVTDGIDGLLGRGGGSSDGGAGSSRSMSTGRGSRIDTTLETSRTKLIDINRKTADGQPIYVEKKTKTEDSPYRLKKIEEIEMGSPTPPPEMKNISTNDTPSHNTIPSDVLINPDDNVTMMTPLKYKIKKVNPDDYVSVK